MNRPIYRDPAGLALVFAGGGLGTLGRAGIGAWIPASASATFTSLLIVNVAGAFLIALVTALAAEGADGRGPLVGARTKLFLTTGFCGGLTTYSSFALLTATDLTGGAAATAIAEAVLMLAAGVAAVVLGNLAGSAIARRHSGAAGLAPRSTSSGTNPADSAAGSVDSAGGSAISHPAGSRKGAAE